MKIIICYVTLLLIFNSVTFGQSVLNYQSGSGVVVQPGADVCADQIQINGTFSGGGTLCGSTPYVLTLTAFIQGFYNSLSNTMISDTVIIYLRNAVSPFPKVDSAKSVLTSSGMGSFIFFNIINGANYYIAIRHRNSIETWSSSGVAFSSGTLSYDFTTASNKAYGNNMILKGTKWCIYNGDVNQDGSVDITDGSLIDNDAFNFVSGYVNTDLDGNNFVDLSDYGIADNNAFNYVTKITPLGDGPQISIDNFRKKDGN